MVILLVGWLALTAQCRLEAGRRSYIDGADNNATVAYSISSLDDGKFGLNFCGDHVCNFGTCYCCDNQKGRPCYKTFAECNSNCPRCNPKCPAESTIELQA
ncbi:hypothetical protein ZWY2020_036822 [Hordeum vulgare]|nr:hypothetical protein ZWY2020_036822 [Hordeum vulgare]